MGVRLDLVGLVVRDMRASLAFYRGLGFTIPREADLEGHVEVSLPGGLFAWDTLEVIHSFDPRFELHPRPAGAFLCDSPAEVDQVYAELVGAAYRGHLPPWDAFWGQRYAQVLDPDGNMVDLFAPL